MPLFSATGASLFGVRASFFGALGQRLMTNLHVLIRARRLGLKSIVEVSRNGHLLRVEPNSANTHQPPRLVKGLYATKVLNLLRGALAR